MLHLRVFVPPDRTEAVIGALTNAEGLYHVMSGGTTARDRQQMIEAEVPSASADDILRLLSGLEIPIEDVLLTRQEPIGPIEGRRRAGLARETLVWAEVVAEARGHALPLIRYFVYMLIAGLIAAFGVIGRNPILIVGAMALSPDLFPLTAAVVGIVGRRPRLAGRAIALLASGLITGAVAALALTRFLVAIGTVPPHLAIGRGGLGILPVVGVDTFVIALGAGVAGILAFETKAQAGVGVAISVTTIPAAAYVGAALALGQPSHAASAAAVLSINVVCLLVAGVITLVIQRRWEERRARSRSADRSQ